MSILCMTSMHDGVKAIVIAVSGGVELFDTPLYVHDDEDLSSVIDHFCKMELIDTLVVRRSEILVTHPHNENIRVVHTWREVYRKSGMEGDTATWVVFVEDQLRAHVGLPPEKETREAKSLIQQVMTAPVINLDMNPPFDPSKMS